MSYYTNNSGDTPRQNRTNTTFSAILSGRERSTSQNNPQSHVHPVQTTQHPVSDRGATYQHNLRGITQQHRDIQDSTNGVEPTHLRVYNGQTTLNSNQQPYSPFNGGFNNNHQQNYDSSSLSHPPGHPNVAMDPTQQRQYNSPVSHTQQPHIVPPNVPVYAPLRSQSPAVRRTLPIYPDSQQTTTSSTIPRAAEYTPADQVLTSSSSYPLPSTTSPSEPPLIGPWASQLSQSSPRRAMISSLVTSVYHKLQSDSSNSSSQGPTRQTRPEQQRQQQQHQRPPQEIPQQNYQRHNQQQQQPSQQPPPSHQRQRQHQRQHQDSYGSNTIGPYNNNNDTHTPRYPPQDSQYNDRSQGNTQSYHHDHSDTSSRSSSRQRSYSRRRSNSRPSHLDVYYDNNSDSDDNGDIYHNNTNYLQGQNRDGDDDYGSSNAYMRNNDHTHSNNNYNNDDNSNINSDFVGISRFSRHHRSQQRMSPNNDMIGSGYERTNDSSPPQHDDLPVRSTQRRQNEQQSQRGNQNQISHPLHHSPISPPLPPQHHQPAQEDDLAALEAIVTKIRAKYATPSTSSQYTTGLTHHTHITGSNNTKRDTNSEDTTHIPNITHDHQRSLSSRKSPQKKHSSRQRIDDDRRSIPQNDDHININPSRYHTNTDYPPDIDQSSHHGDDGRNRDDRVSGIIPNDDSGIPNDDVDVFIPPQYNTFERSPHSTPSKPPKSSSRSSKRTPKTPKVPKSPRQEDYDRSPIVYNLDHDDNYHQGHPKREVIHPTITSTDQQLYEQDYDYNQPRSSQNQHHYPSSPLLNTSYVSIVEDIISHTLNNDNKLLSPSPTAPHITSHTDHSNVPIRVSTPDTTRRLRVMVQPSPLVHASVSQNTASLPSTPQTLSESSNTTAAPAATTTQPQTTVVKLLPPHVTLSLTAIRDFDPHSGYLGTVAYDHIKYLLQQYQYMYKPPIDTATTTTTSMHQQQQQQQQQQQHLPSFSLDEPMQPVASQSAHMIQQGSNSLANHPVDKPSPIVAVSSPSPFLASSPPPPPSSNAQTSEINETTTDVSHDSSCPQYPSSLQSLPIPRESSRINVSHPTPYTSLTSYSTQHIMTPPLPHSPYFILVREIHLCQTLTSRRPLTTTMIQSTILDILKTQPRVNPSLHRNTVAGNGNNNNGMTTTSTTSTTTTTSQPPSQSQCICYAPISIPSAPSLPSNPNLEILLLPHSITVPTQPGVSPIKIHDDPLSHFIVRFTALVCASSPLWPPSHRRGVSDTQCPAHTSPAHLLLNQPMWLANSLYIGLQKGYDQIYLEPLSVVQWSAASQQ